MKRIVDTLCSHVILLITAIGTTVTSVGFSLHRADFIWFGRSGSLLCAIGTIMASRFIIRSSRTDIADFLNMNIMQAISDDEKNERYKDHTAFRYGLCIILSGTIIWGFGDLI